MIVFCLKCTQAFTLNEEEQKRFPNLTCPCGGELTKNFRVVQGEAVFDEVFLTAPGYAATSYCANEHRSTQ